MWDYGYKIYLSNKVPEKHPETPKDQFVEALQEICILKYFKKHEELVGVARSEQSFPVFKWAGE